jgi:hypothetical protein
VIWRNPWAFLGALAVAVPVLIHLLSRRQANVIRFPSLRFIDATRTVPVRRTRISDPLVLLVRALIVLTAVGALAQPLRMTAARTAVRGEAVARVIVVDTTASMSRRDSIGGGAARAAAFATAEELRRDATASVVVASMRPASDLAGALAWLDARPSMREVVFVSDFQLGTLDSVDVAGVPLDVGIRLVRVPVVVDSASPQQRSRARVLNGRTSVEWMPSRDDVNAGDPTVLSGPADGATADAVRAAMRAFRPPGSADTVRRIAIVLPGAPDRAQMMRDAKPLDAPWMASMLVAVESDSLLAAVGPAVRAASGAIDGRPGLLLFVSDSATPYAAAATAVAAVRASALVSPANEADPDFIPDALLRSWERQPTPPPPSRLRGLFDESDGRWLWVAVLLLLGAEWWLRRSRTQGGEATAAKSPDEVRYRAA